MPIMGMIKGEFCMRYVLISGSTATIAVEGRFDLCKTVEVQVELTQAYQQGCTKVCVDFSQTTYIDSSAIRDLVKTRRKVTPENFSGVHAGGVVLAALKAAKLDSWLK